MLTFLGGVAPGRGGSPHTSHHIPTSHHTLTLPPPTTHPPPTRLPPHHLPPHHTLHTTLSPPTTLPPHSHHTATSDSAAGSPQCPLTQNGCGSAAAVDTTIVVTANGVRCIGVRLTAAWVHSRMRMLLCCCCAVVAASHPAAGVSAGDGVAASATVAAVGLPGQWPGATASHVILRRCVLSMGPQLSVVVGVVVRVVGGRGGGRVKGLGNIKIF